MSRAIWMALAGMIVMSAASLARAEIKTQKVSYKADGVTMQGWLAYDDAIKDKQPGVVVFPEWWGLNDFAKGRAEALAKLGYVALAADMYGNGEVTTDPKQAATLSGNFRNNPKSLFARAQAALDELSGNERVDPKRLNAIGYCFGGTVALELAMTGADLSNVVTFHGGLDLPNLDQAGQIKAKVLICTGGADAFVPPAQVQAMEEALSKAKVDWEVNVYGGAHHAFSNPDAGQYHMPNVEYNEKAAKRSWAAMKAFLEAKDE